MRATAKRATASRAAGKISGGRIVATDTGLGGIIVRVPASADEGALAATLVNKAGDPSDVKRLCETYGLRREDLGRLTGFSLRALAEWSAGRLPSEPAKRRLHEIRRLLDSLAEVVRIDAIPAWLRTRNAAFDHMTPIQVIEVGEIDRLWQMVYHMGSDSPD